MKLYLAQHGDAVAKTENPDRPLSSKGQSDVENMARFLASSSTTLDSILHSGKLRAMQTAEILMQQVSPGGELKIYENINPLDSPVMVVKEIEQWQSDTLLVGHLPHLAKLASLLLTDREDAPIISFTPGTIACLNRSAEKQWSLTWLLSPEIIGKK